MMTLSALLKLLVGKMADAVLEGRQGEPSSEEALDNKVADSAEMVPDGKALIVVVLAFER